MKTSEEYIEHGKNFEYACEQAGLDHNDPESFIDIYDSIFVEVCYSVFFEIA